MMIKDYVNDLRREFLGYNATIFTRDLMAGLTVTAVALPLALAFGVGSGATAASGLITAIIAGITISAFSGASFQISGPTGAMAAILITLISKYGMQGVFVAGLMAGILLVVAGILKLGRIISFIPTSVISGFTSGIAIIIALGQVDNFFGVRSEGEMAAAKVFSYYTNGFHPDLPTTGIGLLVVLIMLVWPKAWNARVPSSLASLILVLLINSFFRFEVAMVGEIPKTLFLSDRLFLSQIDLETMSNLVIPAMSIAALAMIESLLCGASAGRMKQEKLNGDRELVAQGIGNILCPFFGGIPATAAIARTSVAIKSGCETRMTGIIHALGLLLSMFLLAPVMSKIPLSALAGVLMVTAWRMNDWENIHYIFGKKFKAGMAKFYITMAATVLLDLTQAIIIGVAFSAFLIVVRLTDIDINISEVDPRRLEEIGIHLEGRTEHIRIAYLTGTIFFAVVEKLKEQILVSGETTVLILSMRGVPVIDLSGVQAMIELTAELQQNGIEVMYTSVQPKVMKPLERGGLMEVLKPTHVFPSAELAILHAYERH